VDELWGQIRTSQERFQKRYRIEITNPLDRHATLEHEAIHNRPFDGTAPHGAHKSKLDQNPVFGCSPSIHDRMKIRNGRENPREGTLCGR
jgi:hypothetical protein